MLPADLRYAVRTLRKAPVFTTATVLTMTLTIGANTAIFSVVNDVLIRPLPFASPDRLMQVAEKNDKLVGAGLQPRDPLTFAAVGALLLAVALAACMVPARRASRVDPIVALHEE